MISPSILLPDSFWILKIFCAYQLNLLVLWCSITPTSDLSPTSTSGLPHRHSQNKAISATKKITLCLHICVLVWLHTAECSAPELKDFIITTGILFSADGTPHLNQTGPVQHYRTEPLLCVCWGEGKSTENHFSCKGSLPPLCLHSLEKAHPLP